MNKTIAKENVRRYYSVWRDVSTIYEEWCKQHHISSNSLFVLYSLWDNPDGCTQKVMGDQWVLPKQTINTILKEFEKKGYILFTSSETDHRSKIAKLTPLGKDYANDLVFILHNLEISVIETMGQEKIDAILDNTALFVEHFKKGMVENNEKT